MKIESTQRGFEYGVRHLRCDEPASLEMLLKHSLDFGPDQTSSLLAFGAIYVDGNRCLNAPAQPLPSGTVVRVHTNPRRYPMNSLKLEQVIFESDDFLLFNKPSGVPVHASVDNFHENVLGFLAQHSRKGFTTHRLDVATSGLLVIAKTLQFQKSFNHLLATNQVNKTYRALSHGRPLSTGTWTHFMESSPRAPKTVQKSDQENYLNCELEVLESQPKGEYAESRIRLITGRTHQIRAQLSFENSPIVGDQMYGSNMKLAEFDAICLQACELSLPDDNGKKLSFTLEERPDFYQRLVSKDQN